MENKQVVLSVKDLRVNFSTDHGYVQAVRGVSFDLYKGETLCIVGESGSGKSVTSKTIMGILAANGRIVDGSIMYEGEDLTKVSEDEFHRIRGHKIGMIFQEELVAEEFVAYKNAITAYKSELNKGKETVKFLKSEKKKEVERIKTIVKNETDGAVYALKLDHGLEKVHIKHKYDELIAAENAKLAALKEGQQADAAETPEEINQKIVDLKAAKAGELKEADERYVAKKAEILKEAEEKKAANKEELVKVKANFDKRIAEAKATKNANSKELKAKYKPIIAEAKAKYLAKNKEANAKIAEVKKQYRAEYEADLKNGVDKKTAKNKYVSKIKITKAEAKQRALKVMEEVGIPFPERRFRQYPFEFSGGMRQRIVIAIALTANPDILICDEPTTALDVTIQAQILELINRLKAERNISVIFITHDLGVVANMADRVAVMYAGKIVEYGKEEEIFYDPKHPYTWALLSSIPDVDSKERLEAIPGTPPNLVFPPKGDAFALRSKYAMKIDFKKEPPYFKVSDTHYAATWLLDPRAPKVEMPAIVKTRIEASLAAHKAREAQKAKAKKEDK